MAVSSRVAQGLRRERTLASPRFRDGRFENTDRVASPMKPGERWSTVREYFFGARSVERRPSHALPVESPLDGWARPASSGLRVTWLGHSTTLLELDGARVLTDPVWGERASPVAFAGPRRFHPAPVPIDALPPLDAILVSHDHFDHLDRPTIRALARTGAPFVTSLGVGAHLEAWGVPADRMFELDWWKRRPWALSHFAPRRRVTSPAADRARRMLRSGPPGSSRPIVTASSSAATRASRPNS